MFAVILREGQAIFLRSFVNHCRTRADEFCHQKTAPSRAPGPLRPCDRCIRSSARPRRGVYTCLSVPENDSPRDGPMLEAWRPAMSCQFCDLCQACAFIWRYRTIILGSRKKTICLVFFKARRGAIWSGKMTESNQGQLDVIMGGARDRRPLSVAQVQADGTFCPRLLKLGR